MVEAARRRWGRIDVLHYNVGVSIAGGDAPLDEITEPAFDRIATINLRGAIMTCKHVLPLMRAQRAGVIITISSVAAWERYPNVAYKATKAGMIAFHPASCHPECRVRGARQCHPTWIDRHPDGGRYARPRQPAKAEQRSRPPAMPGSRCATRWAPPGTSRTLRCFWHPTRQISLPALRCRSMAERLSTSIEPPTLYNCLSACDLQRPGTPLPSIREHGRRQRGAKEGKADRAI